MKRIRQAPVSLLMTILFMVIPACAGNLAAEAPASKTPITTNTISPRPTWTPRPTATAQPTRTSHPEDIQLRDDMLALVNNLYEKGYISSNNGKYYRLNNFSKNFGVKRKYRWWSINMQTDGFVLDAHFVWSPSDTPVDSGCGIVFAIQENGDKYSVFLDRRRIAFIGAVGKNRDWPMEIETVRGKGNISLSKPGEADFTLAVDDHRAFVLVDDQFIGEYKLLEESDTSGDMGFGVLSGTNENYGTRCTISNARLWKIE